MRARNEGTIRQRSNGLWEARYSLADGSRESVYGRTRREVALKLRDALSDARPVAGGRQRLDHYLEAWLEITQGHVAPSTWKNDVGRVRNHLIPELGRIRIGDLTPADVEQFLARKLAQGLSPQTVIHLRGLLRRGLGRAVRQGMLSRNVASLADPPRLRRVRDWRTLDQTAAQHFLSAVKGHWLEALWILYLTTGMRRGEALALRWQDVDLEAGTVTVRGSLQALDGSTKVVPTKTIRSDRTLELPSLTQAALERHLALLRNQRVRALPTAFVFPSARGGPLNPSNVYRSFRRMLASLSLAEMRIVDLRHSFATLMLRAGEHPKVVQEALGHSSIVHSMNTYSHVMPGLKKGAAARLDQLLRDTSGVSSGVHRGGDGRDIDSLDINSELK